MKLTRTIALTTVLLAGSIGLRAQGTPVPATDETAREVTSSTIDDLTDNAMMADKKQGSMFEVGIRPSYSWVAGDVDATGGYGMGLHFRKALDHVFSFRVQGLYAVTSGDDRLGRPGNRRFESRWASASLMGVASLNNIKYEGDQRKTNFYVMAGGGAHAFRVASQKNGTFFGGEVQANFDEDDPLGDNSRNQITEREIRPHVSAGAGFAYRISSRFNVGVEYQGYLPLGDNADRIDGYRNGNFGDIQNNASVVLNVNLGNPDTQTEPRYWENPFNPVKRDLMGMEAKVNAATNDSDGDGVVDAIDQEAGTPMGAPVDTKGRLLDSDADGVADYQDLEPFFPPRPGEVVDANGVVTERIDAPVTEDRIQQMIDASIARMQANDGPATTSIITDAGTIYLPIIYFPLDQATVKYGDYGTLSSVARVLQSNGDLRMVVRGYTDKVGTEAYNERLSYRRALNVVNHLVNQHNISRDRLVLQFRGEEDQLVPQNRSVVNRRVEFLSAGNDAQETPHPRGCIRWSWLLISDDYSRSQWF